ADTVSLDAGGTGIDAVIGTVKGSVGSFDGNVGASYHLLVTITDVSTGDMGTIDLPGSTTGSFNPRVARGWSAVSIQTVILPLPPIPLRFRDLLFLFTPGPNAQGQFFTYNLTSPNLVDSASFQVHVTATSAVARVWHGPATVATGVSGNP